MRIALINMPFSRVELPSLALTQLKARLDALLQGRTESRILYLNMDFAAWLGADLHGALLDATMNTGVGEWFFRQAAFPEQPDNAEEFFARAFAGQRRLRERLKRAVAAKREELPAFLDALIERHGLEQEELVGFTSMFSQNVASLALARRLKQRRPALLTALGGANCEAPMGPELLRRVDWIDFVFSGPALVSFPRVVGHLLDGEAAACDAVPGVFTHGNLEAGVAPLGEELSIDTPVPLDYDDFLADYDLAFPETPAVPSVLFETSRGCWWGEKAHCTFCGLNGLTMKYRFMGPEAAVELIRGFFRYAPRPLNLQSVDNILPKNYVAEVLPRLDTPPSQTLFYEIKADVGEADFEAFRKARVKFVQPGIEALNTETLKRMKKGTTAFHNLALLKRCALYDVHPAWNLLVGFPGEPAAVFEKYARDLPLLTHLPAPIGVASVRFDRYSPYFTRPQDYGLKLRPFDFYGLTYPFPPEALKRIAYYFVDDVLDAPYIADLAAWIEVLNEQVETWRVLWDNGTPEPSARLYRSGPAEVTDSRSGAVERVSLDETEGRALEMLEEPLGADRLAHALAVPAETAAELLGRLQERRLLFEERGRYMSLVLAEPAPPREYPLGARNPAAVATA